MGTTSSIINHLKKHSTVSEAFEIEWALRVTQLMVTSENGENHSIQFKISNNRPTFDSIQNDRNTIGTIKSVTWWRNVRQAYVVITHLNDDKPKTDKLLLIKLRNCPPVVVLSTCNNQQQKFNDQVTTDFKLLTQTFHLVICLTQFYYWSSHHGL